MILLLRRGTDLVTQRGLPEHCDSHETLANGVVVQVLSLNLHFTFLTSFPLLSFMSQTHKLGERRALEQWGADEEVHADLCSRPTEPQEVLCPQ